MTADKLIEKLLPLLEELVALLGELRTGEAAMPPEAPALIPLARFSADGSTPV